MSDIETLSINSVELNACPVITSNNDVVVICNRPLRVIATREVVGDDYGSWANLSVEFECGHTLRDMTRSMQMEEYI